MGVNGRLAQTRAQEIATAFREDVPVDGACLIAHPTGEIAEPVAQPHAVQILDDRAHQHRLQLADARELPPAVPEILPAGMTGADRARRVNGKALVDQQLAQRCLPAGLPIRVVAAGTRDNVM